MKIFLPLLPLIAATLLAGAAQAQELAALTRGQSIYLPVYSHIYHGSLDRKGRPDTVMLSALVSIRSTDAKLPIRILSARYYNTDGKLLREFVPAPRTIQPFGTLELFVERHDESGGSGANFVISWEAETPANPPVIEAVHASFEGARSVAFTTSGKPIRPID